MAAASSGASPRMADRLRGASRDCCGCGVVPDGAAATGSGRLHPRADGAAAGAAAAAAGLVHTGAVPSALEVPPSKNASTSANRASAIVGFVGFVGASSFLNEAQQEAALRDDPDEAAAGNATGGAATTGCGSISSGRDVGAADARPCAATSAATGAQPSLTEPPAEAAGAAGAAATAAAADGPPTDRTGPSRVPSQKLRRRPLSPPRRRSVRQTGWLAAETPASKRWYAAERMIASSSASSAGPPAGPPLGAVMGSPLPPPPPPPPAPSLPPPTAGVLERPLSSDGPVHHEPPFVSSAKGVRPLGGRESPRGAVGVGAFDAWSSSAAEHGANLSPSSTAKTACSERCRSASVRGRQ